MTGGTQPASASLPDGLVGRPADLPACEWHRRALARTTGERRQYHDRWLAHLLAPGEDERRPLVSIVIPVYNRDALVVEAVDSCLRQSYAAIEVIVVDDGSTDRLEETLRPYAGAIRVLRQPNRGVAAARNAGIAAARGEFIHFLDSDNLLYAHCIERKVQAFAAIADAELCYSTFDEVDAGGKARASGVPAPAGGPRCATIDLMRATCTGYPFIVSTVMLPRWLCLDAGQFEEDLSTEEDRRYWFRLGLRGVKAVGYDYPLALRRRTADSLTVNRLSADPSGQIVAWRNMLDLVRQPEFWCYVPEAFARVLHTRAMIARDPVLMALRARLESEVADAGDAGSRNVLSPLPMLLACRLALDEAAWLLRARAGAADDFPQRLARALEQGLRRGRAMTRSDVEYWNRCSERDRAGPLPALLQGLADPSPRSDEALSALNGITRAWAQDDRISAWYAYPAARFRLQATGRPGVRLAFVGAWRRRCRRWRALRTRLARRMRVGLRSARA